MISLILVMRFFMLLRNKCNPTYFQVFLFCRVISMYNHIFHIMDMDITKIGERDQVVIPLDMRKGLVKGEKLMIIKDKDKFILEPIRKMKARNIDEIREDLEVLKAIYNNNIFISFALFKSTFNTTTC